MYVFSRSHDSDFKEGVYLMQFDISATVTIN